MTAEPRPDVSRLRSFTLGDWLVEPKACQLSRAGSAVKLRPQLVDLLACLARHAGEIALKDEILADVWPGQYIAESGLSRCIAELRQVLQDDVQQPRYIETITKRGYRLVAPVVWLEDRQAAPRDQPAPEARAQAGGAAEAIASSPPAAEPWRTRRLPFGRSGTWAAVAVLLLAAGVVVAVMLARAPAMVLTERDPVLLADVRNSTGDPVFDDTLRLALAVNLEQAPFLHILPQDAVRAAVARTGRAPDERVVGSLALEVCRREGAAVLLAGSIAPLGSRYAVGLEAILCTSGDTLARALVQVDGREGVLPALQQAATRIRQKLGESRESLEQHDVPLERATTSSLDALRALTLGDRDRVEGRFAEAMTLYRQATDLDPEFALAWARRGSTARSLGDREESQSALRRAYDLRDRVSLPERFYIEAHYVFEQDPEAALEVYRTWRRMYPASLLARNNLAALLHGMMGQYEEAVPEAREAVRLSQGAPVAYRNLAWACLGARRLDEARQAVAEGAKRDAAPYVHRLRLYIALIDGDRAGLERETRPGAVDPLLAFRLLASDAMAGGRLKEARRVWSAALQRASEIGDASRVAELRRYQAEAEALLGDAGAAREAIQAATAADRRPPTIPVTAIVFALAGDPARGRELLGSLDRGPQSLEAAVLRRVSLPAARALVSAVEGDGARAVELMQPATPFARGSDYALVPLGVWAVVEMQAGRPADAVPLFRDVVRLRGVEPASPWVTFARLGLARALRDSGDRAGSLAAYDAFLESWKDADPDAPLLAAARRERAALTSH